MQKEAQIGELMAKGDRAKVSFWRTQRDAAVIVLLLNTGLRVSEVASLTLSDVEIKQRSGRVTVVGKGNKKRIIPLNSAARRALGDWLEVRPEALRLETSSSSDLVDTSASDSAEFTVEASVETLRPKAATDALLVGQRGRPLSSRAIQRIVKKYAERAGLDGVTPHTLRHTFAKGLVDAGVSLDRVAMLLGHESINTTRIYTTPSKADLAEAVEKLI